MNTEFHLLLWNGLCRCIYKIWMEGTYDIPNKIHISSRLLNQIGWGFRQNADDSYIFIFLEHNLYVNSRF